MEIKKEIFKRLPPGDRWVAVNNSDGRVYTPLTEALEQYFQEFGVRQYYIDAGTGIIYKVEDAPEPKPQIKQFSIYGDY
jgi:cystathionine beta-lyase/cystathionine gamma-synthase